MTAGRVVFGPRRSDPSSYRSHAEILAVAVARSTAAARGYALLGDRWARHSCSALPPCWALGSASDSSIAAIAANMPDRDEAHSLGDHRLRTPSPVARNVLSARSCRTIHAAATWRTFRALLWRDRKSVV